jgi:type VII secretion protein EccB
MPSRQDQLHSYQFSAQRVVSALVVREPDPAQAPGRRLAGASLAGALVAVLSLAAVAVFGVIAPGGSDTWRSPGTVVVERESGARYVYLDGVLHPVLNYASARLLAGASAHTATVSANSLTGVARGEPLGIPGAPDSLPAKDRLLTGGWSVCSARLADGPESVLFVGAVPAHGRPLGEQAVLAQTPDGTRYLLWHGSALRVPRPQVVDSAFSWGGEQPVAVAAALVDAVPAGPDLAPPQIPGRGGSSGALPEKIGTVLVAQAQGGSRQYGVVLAAGLAPISQVQADLLLSDPDAAAVLPQRGAHEVSQAQFAQAPVAALDGVGDALPHATPQLAHPGSGTAAVCAQQADAGAVALTVDAEMTAAMHSAPAPSASAAARPADRIVVPAGHGALVEAVASPSATTGALSLVTDVARRYPLPTPDVAELLGYPSVTPVRVPAALVALLPAGPALDPQAAHQPA